MAWTADLLFALRRLRRAPGFAAAATLMLALGIGLAICMFSVVSGVLLDALPFPDASRVVSVGTTNLHQPGERGGLTPAEAVELAGAESSPFARFGYYNWGGITVFEDGRPRETAIAAVSDGFFATLGVAPALGRAFTPEEHGRKDVVMLSYAEWQRLLGGRSDAIGATIDSSEGPLRVVGVMPEGFDWPATIVGAWLPRAPYRSDTPVYAHARFVNAVGRLRDGVDVAGAQPRLDAIAATVRERHGLPDDGWRFGSTAVLDTVVGDVRGALWGAFAVALLVLLIAGVNVYLLFDARQLARRNETLVAHALGASRARIWRTATLELAMLGGAGVAGGLLLARGAIALLERFAAQSLPRVGAIAMEPRVIAFALLLGVLPPLLVAGAGAWRERRRDALALRGGRGVVGAAGAPRAVPAIALALSTVSLIGAAALGLSMLKLAHVEPGFDAGGVHAVQLFRDPRQKDAVAFEQQLRAKLAALPGVEAVALTTVAPLSNNGSMTIDLQVDGRAEPEDFRAALRRVDAGYLPLLRIPVIAGRGIEATDREGAERVAVVNRELARRAFGAESPLGRTLALPLGSGERVSFRVVGVMEDVRNDGLRSPPSPELLVAFEQTPAATMTFLVRTRAPIEGLVRAMDEQVWAIASRQAISREFALADDLDGQLATVRFFAWIVGIFAALALLLGAFGVYAVATQQQRLRVREFGLRLAIGARPGAIGAQVLRQGLAIVALGAGAGIAGGWAVLKLLAAQTFGVDAALHWVMLAGVAAMALAALAALLVPAIRAARTDAMVALRQE